MSDGAKIIIERASKLFLEGSVVAFRNVDLHINSKEVLCVVGPSGCGKTTLLRCIGGLLTLNSGRVLIDDRPVTSPREGVGIVFQHFGLLPWKTVAENVSFGLQMVGAPRQLIRERTERYIRLVGLESFEAQYPYQLSGGMQQRVGLARALAIEPRVLLLDEPFGALDAKVRKELRAWLRQLHDEIGYTTIFVTHDESEAHELADRVVTMADGCITEAGAVN